ncbi:MAG: bifunctional NAD pyrophosphatase/5'-nucleotidase, partial [Hyphomicrobiales bacterium]|nr:bifunctional NAD pyrophosphatase/5'-nucleotidase [Hyphomicrobiales bacterium]
SLTILHVSDTHSHLDATSGSLYFDGVKTYLNMGGFARLVRKVADVRNSDPETLVLHAGDLVQGTLYFTKYQGEAEFAFMNMIKFDAMAVGNHEFDKGPGLLAGFINDLAEFPIISANIDASNDGYLSDQITPYVIKDVNGEKVGIFGLTTPDTSESSSPGDAIIFEDEKTAAQRTVQKLESQGVNKIIALTHLGCEKDVELAGSVDGIDIVVGGHDHMLMGDYETLGLTSAGSYPTIINSPAGNKVCIVQAWEWAKAAGVLEAEFDADGSVISCEGNAVLLVGDTFLQKDADDNKVEVDPAKKAEILAMIEANPEIEVIEEDSDAIAMLAPYKAGIADMEKEVVATVAEDLLHIREPGTHTSGTELPGGSLIAPVVCESMLWKTNSVGLNADMALHNAGGIRIDIPAGDLTVGTVYTLMPFGNTLFVLELTGKEVKTVLESGLSKGGGAFPNVAGIRYTADKTKPEQLVSVEIKNGSVGWTALDDNTVYRMVTNSYIAGGGDGYDVLNDATAFRYDTGFVDAEVFREYAEYMGTLYRPESTGVTYI